MSKPVAETRTVSIADCVCHQGSVCTDGCQNFHHVGCSVAFDLGAAHQTEVSAHAMNRESHLLWILAEECAEVTQRASKVARFGLYETQPEQTATNQERIMGELYDVLAVIEMLQECKVLKPFLDRVPVETKKEKVEKFLRYSESQGLLRKDSR